jgi:hypothetical protein
MVEAAQVLGHPQRQLETLVSERDKQAANSHQP